MSLSQIAMVIWFAIYGINYFAKIPSVGIVLAIVAIIIAILLVARK